MGYVELLVHFYLKNHTRVVKFSYLNFTPLNLYPTTSNLRVPIGDFLAHLLRPLVWGYKIFYIWIASLYKIY